MRQSDFRWSRVEPVGGEGNMLADEIGSDAVRQGVNSNVRGEVAAAIGDGWHCPSTVIADE